MIQIRIRLNAKQSWDTERKEELLQRVKERKKTILAIENLKKKRENSDPEKYGESYFVALEERRTEAQHEIERLTYIEKRINARMEKRKELLAQISQQLVPIKDRLEELYYLGE